jgi:hypothetical protein
MNLFKPLIVLVTVSLFTHNLSAQELYLNVNAGYAFGTGQMNLSTTNVNATSSTYEVVGYSLGKGVNTDISIGATFNKNIGAELGISYLIGGKTNASSVYLDRKEDFNFAAKMLRFNPSIVIYKGYEKFKPYAKFGVIVGIGGSISSEYKTAYTAVGGHTLLNKQKYNGGLASGFSSALGVIYGLNSKFSLFGELTMINLRYSPTKSKYTESTDNGVDRLSTFTVSQKEYEYVKSYTVNSAIPNPSQPSKALKFKYPFSSIGFNIGIRFSIKSIKGVGLGF